MTVKKCIGSIGEKIKEERKETGMRQKDVAQKAGVNFRYYQEIEAGRVNVTISTLWRIAKTLQTHVATLVQKCATFVKGLTPGGGGGVEGEEENPTPQETAPAGEPSAQPG